MESSRLNFEMLGDSNNSTLPCQRVSMAQDTIGVEGRRRGVVRSKILHVVVTIIAETISSRA